MMIQKVTSNTYNITQINNSHGSQMDEQEVLPTKQTVVRIKLLPLPIVRIMRRNEENCKDDCVHGVVSDTIMTLFKAIYQKQQQQ